MPNATDRKPAAISRRRSMLELAALAGTAGILGTGLAPRQAQAATKVAQKTVAYQTTPKGKLRCDTCLQWQSPSSCKVVEGTISPTGWCSIYAPKA